MEGDNKPYNKMMKRVKNHIILHNSKNKKKNGKIGLSTENVEMLIINSHFNITSVWVDFFI